MRNSHSLFTPRNATKASLEALSKSLNPIPRRLEDPGLRKTDREDPSWHLGRVSKK